jgi:hypothetical protein
VRKPGQRVIGFPSPSLGSDGLEVLPLPARGGVPSKGENPRFGKISPVYVFKLPLGHEYWCDFPKTGST